MYVRICVLNDNDKLGQNIETATTMAINGSNSNDNNNNSDNKQ